MKLKIIIALIFFTAVNLFSQGGSNYSIFGIGDRNYIKGAKYEGLSNTATAFTQQRGINLENPAMWSQNVDTRIQLGYKFNQSIVSQNDQELYQNYGGLDGLTALFNIDTSLGLSFSMGFYGYTNANSYVSNAISVTKNNEQVTGVTTYQVDGGLTRVYFGASVSPLDFLSIGAMIYSNSGVIENQIQSTFNEVNSFLTYSNSEDSFSGSGFRFGLLLEPIKKLMIGAYFETTSTLDVETEVTYGSTLIEDTVFTNEFNYDLPSTLGLGVSYRFSNIIIGADWESTDFSDFQYNQLDNVQYGIGQSYSFGIEKIGSNSPGADALEKWSLRAGAYYKNLYFTFAGSDITELGGSFGFTIPVKGTAEIDAAFTLGQRSGADENLISETFIKMSFNVSIGDNWFRPFNKSFE